MNHIIYEIHHGVAYVHTVYDVRRDLYALMLQRILDTNPYTELQKGTPL